MSADTILHATLIARRFPDGWRGALLRGPSGSGKSELALRAMDAGFRLVADDRVLVWTSGGRVFGRAPDVLHGLVEVRHVEVARRPALAFAPVGVLIDLRPDACDRIPEGAAETLCGLPLPLARLPDRGRTSPGAVAGLLAR